MHFKRSQSFVHNNIPVSHPLGANFKEAIFIIKYVINSKISITLNSMFYFKGYDKNNDNYGGDIVNKVYNSAINDYV
jgi:hypothetical protein